MKKLTKAQQIRRLNIEIFYSKKKRASFTAVIRKLEKELEILIRSELQRSYEK